MEIRGLTQQLPHPNRCPWAPGSFSAATTPAAAHRINTGPHGTGSLLAASQSSCHCRAGTHLGSLTPGQPRLSWHLPARAELRKLLSRSLKYAHTKKHGLPQPVFPPYSMQLPLSTAQPQASPRCVSPLHCPSEAPSAVLCPVLGSPVQER